MTITRSFIILSGAIGALVLSACGGEAGNGDNAATMDMSPEEHARMQGGGAQGEVDRSGAVIRQPVHLTAEQEHALGVVYTTVGSKALQRSIRTVGTVDAAEDKLADVTVKISGFVESLFVSTTGESVRRGQALFELYSPDLVAAQEELLTALRLAARVDTTAEEASRSARQMLQAARRRLSYWDITDRQIQRLEDTGEVTKTLTIVSPVDGIVLEKSVLVGQMVMPGAALYRIADLSLVWIEGDVFERDLQFVRLGAQAHFEVAAYPGEHYMGDINFVYPTIDTESRTNRVRIAVRNPDLRFKPGMFATMFFDTQLPEALVVPLEAVLITGERNLVFVRDEDGMLVAREIVMGSQAGDLVQVLSGLSAGETIVASANFLIDAESRLASTGSGMPGMQHAGEVEPSND